MDDPATMDDDVLGGVEEAMDVVTALPMIRLYEEGINIPTTLQDTCWDVRRQQRWAAEEVHGKCAKSDCEDEESLDLPQSPYYELRHRRKISLAAVGGQHASQSPQSSIQLEEQGGGWRTPSPTPLRHKTPPQRLLSPERGQEQHQQPLQEQEWHAMEL